MGKRSRQLVVRGPSGRDLNIKTNAGPGAWAYVRPWATTAVMVPAGWATHALWGESGWATVAATGGVVAAGGALTCLSYLLTRARTWYACLTTTASTAAATVWMATATVVGTGRPVLDMLILGGATLSLGSMIHTATRAAGSNQTGEQGNKALLSWSEITEVISSLRGSKWATTTAETEVRTEGIVQLEPGQTVDQISSQLPALASAYRLPPGSVRATPDPTDSSRARVTIVKKDMLAKPQPWPGFHPDAVGTSLATRPLELGLYEDGAPLEVDVRNTHCLTVGMSGAGKSRYAKLKLLQLAARNDVFTIAIDVEKGRQTLGPLIPAIGWPAFSKREAKPIIDGLHRAVKARADHLAERGLENWEEGCGLSFVYLLVEEASAILPENEEFTGLMKVARSAGIHIEASLQRATHTNLDTDARSNFGGSMCFGVRTSDDASYALPDYVLEAGAVPENWRKAKPGCCYAALDGIDEDRHSVPARIYDLTNDVINQIVPGLPKQQLDPITAAAFGQAYTNRIHHTAPGQAVTPAAAEPMTPQTVAAPAAVHDSEDLMHEDDDLQATITADPEPDLPGDLDDAMEPVEGAATAKLGGTRKKSKESPAQARARLEAQLQLWRDQGVEKFHPRDLIRVLIDEQGLSRSRAWIQGELKRLTASGHLVHTDDGYEIPLVPPSERDRDLHLV